MTKTQHSTLEHVHVALAAVDAALTRLPTRSIHDTNPAKALLKELHSMLDELATHIVHPTNADRRVLNGTNA